MTSLATGEVKIKKSTTSPEQRVKSAKFTAATIRNDELRHTTNASKTSNRNQSKSPENYQIAASSISINSAMTKTKTSSRSPVNTKRSKKGGGKSKSPTRKSPTKSGRKSRHNNEESSLNFSLNEYQRSTSELEDLSAQGLTLINSKIFQSNFLL